jgi:hypothetical protein
MGVDIYGSAELSPDGVWGLVGEMVPNPEHQYDPEEPGLRGRLVRGELSVPPARPRSISSALSQLHAKRTSFSKRLFVEWPRQTSVGGQQPGPSAQGPIPDE